MSASSHGELSFSSYWRLPPMWNKGQIRQTSTATEEKRGGVWCRWNVKQRLPPPPPPLSWPGCPWSSRGWRGWVTSSISNVIVGLQRGSQFHQGALLAITSWEQNNPALSQWCCPLGQPAGGTNRRARRPCWMMEASQIHTVFLYIIFLVNVRTKGDS